MYYASCPIVLIVEQQWFYLSIATELLRFPTTWEESYVTALPFHFPFTWRSWFFFIANRIAYEHVIVHRDAYKTKVKVKNPVGMLKLNLIIWQWYTFMATFIRSGLYVSAFRKIIRDQSYHANYISHNPFSLSKEMSHLLYYFRCLKLMSRLPPEQCCGCGWR